MILMRTPEENRKQIADAERLVRKCLGPFKSRYLGQKIDAYDGNPAFVCDHVTAHFNNEIGLCIKLEGPRINKNGKPSSRYRVFILI